MERDGACNSLWQETTPGYQADSVFPADRIFDIVVVGAGVSGVTTALLLQKAGKSVLVAEAKNIGFGTTGGTTAHLNTFLDTPYNTIQSKFSNSDAALVAKAVKQALDLIRQNVQEYDIDCGFKELPGYLFSQDAKQTSELEDIYKATGECGVAIEWSEKLPIAIPQEKVARFPGQACFHPLRYLQGLADAFKKAGGTLVENCRVTSVKDGDVHLVTTSRGECRARNLIYATHIPPGVNLLHFRCAPYRSYAMSFKLKSETQFPDALVYDMYNPYHYYRVQEIDGEKYFIAGGEDHKTGHEQNTEGCFRKLEAYVRKYFNVGDVSAKWSSQYFEPTDGLPYIGNLPGHRENMFVATGYSGNGMIYSAVAALILSDIIIKGESEFEELFDPNRVKMVAGFSNFMKEAADVVGKLIGKFIPGEKIDELAELAPGEARIAKYEGHQLAIYKDDNGEIHALNAACTHIKCEVAWNNAEKTWDCPCHGSRFNYTGEMLTAPARKDLEEIKIGAELKVNR